MAPLPATPFCIPDETPVCARVDLLDRLATAGASDPAVQALAAQLRARAGALCAALAGVARQDPAFAATLRVENGCARALALEAFRAAQGVPYVANPNGRDCYQGAAWTLTHGGECKALTVLFCALCRALGLTAQPQWMIQTGAPLNHVYGAVLLDGVWLWADASIKGAALGEDPYAAVARTGSEHVLGLAPAAAAQVCRARPAGGVADVWRGWPDGAWRPAPVTTVLAPPALVPLPPPVRFGPIGRAGLLSPSPPEPEPMSTQRPHLRPAGQASGTVYASSIPAGATVSSNAQGQLVDAAGNVIVDANGSALATVAQLMAAQTNAPIPAANAGPVVASPGLVQVPAYDASGNVLTDATGKPVLQSVPVGSPLAQAFGGPLAWLPGGLLGGALALALVGAVAFGASYAGTHVAIRRAPRREHAPRGTRRASRPLPT